MAQRLERADGFPELLALLDVCDGVVQRPLADAEADRCAEQTLAVQAGHDLREPTPDLANDVLGGHEAVGEEDVVDLATSQRRDAASLNAFGIAGYLEDGQTHMRFLVAAGSRDQQDSPSSVCIRAPRLLAVEYIAIRNRLRPAGDCGDIGSRTGLGDRDRHDLAVRDRGQRIMLLLLGSESLVASRNGRRRTERLDRRKTAPELLEQDRLLHVGSTGAAVFLGDRDAQPTEFGELLVEDRRLILLVSVEQRLTLFARAAFARAEVAHRLLKILLLDREGHACGNRLSGNSPAATPLRSTAGAPPATTLVTQSR